MSYISCNLNIPHLVAYDDILIRSTYQKKTALKKFEYLPKYIYHETSDANLWFHEVFLSEDRWQTKNVELGCGTVRDIGYPLIV